MSQISAQFCRRGFPKEFRVPIPLNCYQIALLGLDFAAIKLGGGGPPNRQPSVVGPLRSGSLHYAALLPLRGSHTKFEPSISKTLGFMA